jgi:hypothetical protein
MVLRSCIAFMDRIGHFNYAPHDAGTSIEYSPYGVTGVMTFQFHPAMCEDVLTFWYCVPGPNIAFQFYPAMRGFSAV